MLTIGAVILLYVGYSLWFTNAVAEVTTRSASDSFLEQVQARIDGTPDDSANAQPAVETEPAADPTAEPAPFVPVEPFALLYIPRL